MKKTYFNRINNKHKQNVKRKGKKRQRYCPECKKNRWSVKKKQKLNKYVAFGQWFCSLKCQKEHKDNRKQLIKLQALGIGVYDGKTEK